MQQHLTSSGPVRSARSAPTAHNIVVDGWNVDCNGCIGVQTFHLEAPTTSSAQLRDQDNSDNSLIWISGRT